jgi:hypothetical protein
MDLKKEYEKLKLKYKHLPSYDEINDEFEFLYLNAPTEVSFPLRFVRRRMIDKFSLYINMIQGMLQPNPGSIVNLQEAKFFSKEDKDDMIQILKELMWFGRQSFFMDTENEESKNAEFIVDAFKEWKRVKKKITIYSRILRDGWKKEIKKEKRDSYVG